MADELDSVKAGILEALEDAVRASGSEAALASGINVASSLPAMWKRRRSVPARYCPAIERFTASLGHLVACERLAPNVEWEVVRASKDRQVV